MLVAVEGIDGAGKRTFTRELISLSQGAGHSASGMSFPRYGRTALSGLIAGYLALRSGHELEPRALAAVFAAERLESLPELAEAMQSDDIVVLDRFVSSNMAYQAAKVRREERAGLIDWIAQLEFGLFELPQPDLTVLLAVPVETAVKRVRTRESVDGRVDLDRHERDIDLLAACDDTYRSLAAEQKFGQWVVLEKEELELGADEIAERVWREHCLPLLQTEKGKMMERST